MKKANKKPTRAKRKGNTAPQSFKCTCGHVALSKYAHKSHKELCDD